MPHPNQICIRRQAPQGVLNVCSFCRSDEIEALSFVAVTTDFPQYNPIISHKESLLRPAKLPDNNVVLAFTDERQIVGVSLLTNPDPDERWCRLGDGRIKEVAVIQVARPWRIKGIAKDLLRLTVDYPEVEDQILYMVGYSWTWDLSDQQQSAMDYRDRLIRLFASQNFNLYQTNEPNIMMRPENLFMARIGDRVSDEIQKKFKMIRFNMD